MSDTFFPKPEHLLQAIVVVSLQCFLAGLLLLRHGSTTFPTTIAAVQAG